MAGAECDIRIGTSGWHYDDWRGRFYPEGLPKNKWFEFYSRHFDTVEVNNTFYRLPKVKSVENWYARAPKDFVYAVKASRFITHIKKLKDAAEPLERFFDVVGLLKDRLGPVLYQLPPSMNRDLARLEDFIELLPKGRKAVFEFRHESWYSDDTFELLDKSGAAFCIHDLDGKESPRVITGDIVYVRFHGTRGRYSGSYPDSQLKNWADWLKQHRKEARAIYCYFNNDYRAYAIGNARTLIEKFGD